MVVMQPGEVKIKNSDGVLHNMHTLLHGESVHQQGPAEVQEDDDGKAREAGVRQGHMRRAQLDARVDGVVTGPAGGHQRQGGVKIDNVPAGKQQGRGVHGCSARRTRRSRSRPGRRPRSAFELKEQVGVRSGAGWAGGSARRVGPRPRRGRGRDLPRSKRTGRVDDSWLPENVATYGQELDELFTSSTTSPAARPSWCRHLVAFSGDVQGPRPGRRAVYSHGNTTLEIVWTVVPSLILDRPHVPQRAGWSKIKSRVRRQDSCCRITAKQFNWRSTYPGPDGKFGTGDDQTLSTRCTCRSTRSCTSISGPRT